MEFAAAREKPRSIYRAVPDDPVFDAVQPRFCNRQPGADVKPRDDADATRAWLARAG